MGANVNNSPIPVPPFKPFPPGYEQFQDPIPTVVHLHGGVTPSDSDGFPEAWFTKERSGIYVHHVRVFQRPVRDNALVSRPYAGHDAATGGSRPGGHVHHPGQKRSDRTASALGQV